MFSDKRVPDDVFRAIGRVTTQMSALEFSLGYCVVELLGGYINVGLSITAELGFRQLLSVTGSLYKAVVADDPLQAEFSAILQDIESLERERNRIVHGQWTFDQSARATVRLKVSAKYRNGVQWDRQAWDAKRIDGFADRIERVSNQLYPFLSKTVEWIERQPPNKQMYAGA